MRVPLLLAVVTVAGSVFAAPASAAPAGLAVSVHAERGVPAGRIHQIVGELFVLYGRIGGDLGVYPHRLTIDIFATHREFAAALWRLQHARPQSSVDDSGSIVHARLLLGPLPLAYLRHNLAHTYTEWLIDRLTGNRDDRLPPETWLYDGLAEAEAYRYEPAGLHCSVGPAPFFDVTRIHTAKRWLEIRAGPLGPVEYCLAALKSRQIIAQLGWPRIDRILRASRSWLQAAQKIERL